MEAEGEVGHECALGVWPGLQGLGVELGCEGMLLYSLSFLETFP